MINKKNLYKKFKSNGYVILKNFLNKDKINALEAAIHELIIFYMKKNNLKIKRRNYDEGIIKLNDIRKDKGNFDSIQVIYNTIRKLPELQSLISDKKLISTIRLLSDIPKNASPYIWESFIRIDPPKDPTYDLRWHQESFFTLPNANCVQLWSPIINEANKNINGTITVKDKSLKVGEIKHHIIKQNNNYVSEGILNHDIDKLNLVGKNINLKPTDILLFHEHLIHKTFHNTGKKVRFSVIANYANPFTSNYKFMNENEVVEYHKKRTANAKNFSKYIKNYSSKGGIRDYSNVKKIN